MPWALDIARAVFALGLGENVGMLFWHVVEQSWALPRFRTRDKWSDPLPVLLKCSDLADEWGTSRQRVHEAKKWLVASRLILEDSDGVWVNKNAHEWINPKCGQPLLNAKQLAYATAARSRGESETCHGTPLQDDTHGCHGTPLQEGDKCHGLPLQPTHACHGLPLQNDDVCHGTPLQNPSRVEDRVRENNKKSEKENTTTEAEVDAVDSWAQGAFRDRGIYELQNIGPNVRLWVRSRFKAAWIREALLAGAANDPTHIVRYANGCLRKWEKAGASTSEQEAAKAAKKAESEPIVYHVASPDADVRLARIEANQREKNRKLQAELAAKHAAKEMPQ